MVEIVFKGIFSALNFSFLRKLLTDAHEVYFNSPARNFVITFSSVIETMNFENYVDFVINTDCLHINEKVVSKVFINLGRKDEDVELLFFFDLKDINEPTQKMDIDYLKSWVEEFQKQYDFEYFICQMDNADEKEYYFNSNGLGPLYDKLSR